MKRFAALVLTLVLCLGLFSACGSEANYNVADVAGAIEGVATIDNPTDFTDDDLTLDMSLDMEATVEEYAGQRTKTNGAPGAVLVVKAKAGQADTVKAALEGYRDGLVAQWDNYKDEFPVGYEQTKNGRVVVKGDYVVLAIAGEGVDYAEIDTAISDALK